MKIRRFGAYCAVSALFWGLVSSGIPVTSAQTADDTLHYYATADWSNLANGGFASDLTVNCLVPSPQLVLDNFVNYENWISEGRGVAGRWVENGTLIGSVAKGSDSDSYNPFTYWIGFMDFWADGFHGRDFQVHYVRNAVFNTPVDHGIIATGNGSWDMYVDGRFAGQSRSVGNDLRFVQTGVESYFADGHARGKTSAMRFKSGDRAVAVEDSPTVSKELAAQFWAPEDPEQIDFSTLQVNAISGSRAGLGRQLGFEVPDNRNVIAYEISGGNFSSRVASSALSGDSARGSVLTVLADPVSKQILDWIVSDESHPAMHAGASFSLR